MVWREDKSSFCVNAKKIAVINLHFLNKEKLCPRFSKWGENKVTPLFLWTFHASLIVNSSLATNRSKMDPTPALCALLLWTWRPVASRMPSFTVTERCEKEAMRSSFQPVLRGKGRRKISGKSLMILFESFLGGWGWGGCFLFSQVK